MAKPGAKTSTNISPTFMVTRRLQRYRKQHTNRRHRKRKTQSRRRRQRGRGKIEGELAENRAALNAALSGTNRESNVLRAVCKNPNNCLSLGQYDPMIKNFFADFNDLTMVNPADVSPISSGVNGFVQKVGFQRDGITAYVALKGANKPTSDSLYYEWYVGKNYINIINTLFPCFVETYNMYAYKANVQDHYDMLSNHTGSSPPIHLPDLLHPINHTYTWGSSCRYNKYQCLTTQYFGNCFPMGDMFRVGYGQPQSHINIDCMGCLYQVYYALAQIVNTYTHYDLHQENILLYKPFEGKKYVEMHYHIQGHVMRIRTEYIAKIIDYGRNYFQNAATGENSDAIYRKICNAPECKGIKYPCGIEFGYMSLNGRPKYYAEPRTKNCSADLRLIHYMFRKLRISRVYIHYETQHGTPENLDKNDTEADGTHNVYNVQGAFLLLHKIIEGAPTMFEHKYNDADGWQKAGEIHVYEQRGREKKPYTFTYIDAVGSQIINAKRATVTAAAAAPTSAADNSTPETPTVILPQSPADADAISPTSAAPAAAIAPAPAQELSNVFSGF